MGNPGIYGVRRAARFSRLFPRSSPQERKEVKPMKKPEETTKSRDQSEKTKPSAGSKKKK